MKQPEISSAAHARRDIPCAKQGFSPTFLVLSTLFSICLIVANLMEIKTVSIGPMTITAGVVVFPVSYIISDCIVEVYGFSRARFVIWLGFAMNLLVTLLFQIGLWLPGDADWQGQAAMETVFGAVPRILLASFTAFLCGSMVNAYVMEKMRIASEAGHGFSKRAIVSTVFGEGADSAIFFPIAFGGVLPTETVVTLIITQTLLKTAYEIVILPVTIRAVGALRRIEARHDWAGPKEEPVYVK
ncbi:MAG: queuosine precursor transporter [Paramuribaculum sp.]|nr:queuosine precursor transporter [Paramuribaculum sp.]MDE6322748.1 queuosine precursor transporter [Paramuribaculum sp.]